MLKHLQESGNYMEIEQVKGQPQTEYAFDAIDNFVQKLSFATCEVLRKQIDWLGKIWELRDPSTLVEEQAIIIPILQIIQKLYQDEVSPNYNTWLYIRLFTYPENASEPTQSTKKNISGRFIISLILNLCVCQEMDNYLKYRSIFVNNQGNEVDFMTFISPNNQPERVIMQAVKQSLLNISKIFLLYTGKLLTQDCADQIDSVEKYLQKIDVF